MIASAGGRFYHSAMAHCGAPSRGAIRLRATILRHSALLLRVALLSGALLGYALSEFTR